MNDGNIGDSINQSNLTMQSNNRVEEINGGFVLESNTGNTGRYRARAATDSWVYGGEMTNIKKNFNSLNLAIQQRRQSIAMQGKFTG